MKKDYIKPEVTTRDFNEKERKEISVTPETRKQIFALLLEKTKDQPPNRWDVFGDGSIILENKQIFKHDSHGIIHIQINGEGYENKLARITTKDFVYHFLKDDHGSLILRKNPVLSDEERKESLGSLDAFRKKMIDRRKITAGIGGNIVTEQEGRDLLKRILSSSNSDTIP